MMKKILIIEDDGAILKPITFLLKNARYNVEAINDGSMVVSRMKEFSPDLLLLDVRLSGYSGSEICKQLKSNELFSHVPIILMSASYDIKEIANDSEADDFIAKPFVISELLNKIKKNLHKYSTK